MISKVKTDDKWRVYAHFGEPHDPRMDGQEAEPFEDCVLEEESAPEYGPTDREKAFYAIHGHEPGERIFYLPWPASEPQSVPVKLSAGARWSVRASELPEFLGRLVRLSNCQVLKFDASVQSIEGVKVLTLVFNEALFETISFESFKWDALDYWLNAVDGKTMKMLCHKDTGDIWFCDSSTGEPLNLDRMLALPCSCGL